MTEVSGAKNYLDSYLDNLGDDRLILVSSRWPGVDKVVCKYPTNFFERVTLFFKTLHFEIPTADKKTYIEHSVQSLKIYQHCVEYQLLHVDQSFLVAEQRALRQLQTLLTTVQNQLSQGIKHTDEQKNELRELVGSLTDLQCPLQERKGAVYNIQSLLNFNRSPQLQRPAVKMMLEKIAERLEEIPVQLTEHASKLKEFDQVLPSPQVSPDGATSFTPLKYLVREKPLPQMVALYKQIDSFISTWQNYRSKDQETVKQVTEFVQFFTKLHNNDALASQPDIANGYAYSQALIKGLNLKL
jgi:hypothetical protein